MSEEIGYLGAVAFLDRLGTKGIWKAQRPTDVLARYSRFLKLTKEFVEISRNKLLPDQAKNLEFSIGAFSDTIVFTCSYPENEIGGTKNQISVTLLTHLLPFVFVMGLREKIFLRGAVSFGKFYNIQDLFLGPAIDEAAQYYTMPEWVGISAAPSLHYFLSKYKSPSSDAADPRDYFVPWDIPIKNGVETKGLAVNWPSQMSTFRKKDPETYSLISDIPQIIDSQLQSTDVTISLKWRNTLAFYEKYKDNNGNDHPLVTPS